MDKRRDGVLLAPDLQVVTLTPPQVLAVAARSIVERFAGVVEGGDAVVPARPVDEAAERDLATDAPLAQEVAQPLVGRLVLGDRPDAGQTIEEVPDRNRLVILGEDVGHGFEEAVYVGFRAARSFYRTSLVHTPISTKALGLEDTLSD
jgi:hypothetical protein